MMKEKVEQWNRTRKTAPLRPNHADEKWFVIPKELVRQLSEEYQEGEDLPHLRNSPFIHPPSSVVDYSEHDYSSSDELSSESPSDRPVPGIHTLIQDKDFQQNDGFEVYPERVFHQLLSLGVKCDASIPRACCAREDGYVVEVQPKILQVFLPVTKMTKALSLCGQVVELSVEAFCKISDIGDSLRHVIQSLRCLPQPSPAGTNYLELRCTAAFVTLDFSVSSTESLTRLIRNVYRILNVNWTYNATDCLILKSIFGEPSSRFVSVTYDLPNAPPIHLMTVGDIVDSDKFVILLLDPSSLKRDPHLEVRLHKPPKSPSESSEAPSAEQLNLILGSGSLVGLHNLCNTCFMNSALQCLSHTLPLTRYYLSKDYLQDLNVENVLGMQGVLARTYANFLQECWQRRINCGNRTPTVVPRELKKVIGKYAPNFQGFAQQDAQELLGFLLDGLHEDCNRVREKPYTESLDAGDEQADRVIAEEAWRRHKMRNDSKVVDLFQGQYRSRLECPVCGHVSKTFDPFMYCSLPIPQKRRIAVNVTLLIKEENTSWPFMFPIEIAYREENLSKLRESYEMLGGTDRCVPAGMLRRILACEQAQITYQIALVLLELYHSVLNTENVSRDIKRLFDFLAASPQFTNLYDKAKSLCDSHDESARLLHSQQPMVRAFSADKSSTYPSQNFTKLTVQGAKEIVNMHTNKDRMDAAKDKSYESPHCLPRLCEADSKLFMTEACHVEVTSAVIPPSTIKLLVEDDLHRESDDFLGDEQFAHFLCVLDIQTKAKVQAYPILISASIHLPSELRIPNIKQNVITLTFMMGEASTADLNLRDFFTLVLQTCVTAVNDIIGDDSINEGVKYIERAHAVPFDYAYHGGPVVNSELRYNRATGQVELETGEHGRQPVEMSMKQFTDQFSFHPIGHTAERMNRIHFDIHMFNEFWNRSTDWTLYIKECDAKGGPEFLSSHLWHATSLARASLSLYPRTAQIFQEKYAGSPWIMMFQSPWGGVRKGVDLSYHACIQTIASGPISLSDCFTEFAACERLEDDNQWYCSKCKNFQPAAKKMDFWRLPDILVVHLKRFSQSSRLRRQKVQTRVEFPWKDSEMLDMSEFLLNDSPDLVDGGRHKYRLFAVSNHVGVLASGHYTACVKCYIWDGTKYTEGWYDFDDTRVEEVESDVRRTLTEGAYILFYERMGDAFYKND